MTLNYEISIPEAVEGKDLKIVCQGEMSEAEFTMAMAHVQGITDNLLPAILDCSLRHASFRELAGAFWTSLKAQFDSSKKQEPILPRL